MVDMNWFERHLNLTWLLGAIFVLVLGTVLINFAGLDVLEKGSNQAYFFIWCMLPLNGWLLWQKGRSLHWLWLAFFFVPYIPLILGNKKTISMQVKTPSLPDKEKDKIDKEKKRKQPRQKATPKPLKSKKMFYVLGIAFSALIALGVIASITILATRDQRDQVEIPQLGDKAPDFTLESIEGENISLSDFRGKTILLVFDMVILYRSPSPLQIPYIRAVYEQSKETLVVIYVYRENPKIIKQYATYYKMTDFVILIDFDTTKDYPVEWADGWEGKVTNPDPKVEILYGTKGFIPSNFIIDANGIIKAIKFGVFESQEEIEDMLKAL
jgi:peroxiredoxin